MQVEWEITLKCNYRCHYCTNLDTSLRPVLEEDRIREFIKMLGETYPGVEVFVFGGEPFVHPKINFIIKTFNEFGVPFVIQTNFSKHSRKIMSTITDPYKINISVHPTETTIDDIVEGLATTSADIKTIDVMYTGKEAIQYYLAVKKFERPNTFLTPVTDFGDGISDLLLAEYNQLREHPVYSKIIVFENIIRVDSRQRSVIWLDSNFTTKGKPCLYGGKYFLYSPNLDLYNCCYRLKTDGTCPKDKCFLM